MQQLDGLDAFFALNERQHAPMHIAAFSVYKPSTTKHKNFLQQEIHQSFQERLSTSPIFRRRLFNVSYGMDHPYWIEDQNFDLKHHIFSHSIKDHDGDLESLLANLHAQAMNMTRPLWEVHVIHGLGTLKGYDKGTFGLYLKVHHAAMDGVSGTEILAGLHNLAPQPFSPSEQTDDWQPDTMPSQWALGRQACINNLRKPINLTRQARTLIPSFKKAASLKISDHTPKVSWQKSPFNTRIDAERNILLLRFDFCRLRQIRRHYPHTTVNHVMLSIVGGALRRYLIALNSLPENPLASMVPVNVRNRDSNVAGNAISMLLANLRTDIECPLQRLQAVRDAANNAKDFSKSIGRTAITSLVREMPNSLGAATLRTLSSLAYWPGGIAAPACTIVSNVPGPPVPLYFNDAKMVDMMCLGLIIDHLGLFHVATSYNGVMTLSVLSSPSSLTEPEIYRRCLQESYEALDEAVSRAASSSHSPLAKRA
ncbi:wax ester/triacylglycerol synthase family O-acyltransferase [Zhongshania aquimaris]|uniref:diacylglycerol O-acyltransferase n=1 Tax=Zhongshania aquimaris TaxID=2857107 RepID=A0ABS6VUU0_9GAMM|nr:wax ester/triacylglycerol synthase family O-acyltransferase [Zhongshania aquimaris]MBW2942094.1 wax ester/triacylglycerol synthase family O-acyltransferase [Zhongshania aquimaris]